MILKHTAELNLGKEKGGPVDGKEWVFAISSIASSLFAAIAAIAAFRANQISTQQERHKREVNQDITHWLTIRRGLVAVRSSSSLTDEQIRDLREEVLRNTYLIPSYALNRYWSFKDHRLERLWQELWPVFQAEAEELWNRVRNQRSELAVAIEPQGGSPDFEKAYERLVTAIEESFGASNPRALGDDTWKAFTGREV